MKVSDILGPRALDADIQTRLHDLFEDGWEHWHRFDAEVRQREFHPFVNADYRVVLQALLPLRPFGGRFLEWGSGTGVITIMADLLGFDAHGIELDAQLVEVARTLAHRHGSKARFAVGSFLPTGYRWKPRTGRRTRFAGAEGDDRMGTIGSGESAYRALEIPLDEFRWVYGYPWTGEEALMMDLMQRYGSKDAELLMYRGTQTVERLPGGKA
ncbi:MAG: hypothetical protein WEA09_10505 [Gemmatimonadota bacterium]